MRWFAFLCLLLFAVAGIEEAAHFHLDAGKGPDEQHCSLCIAAHSLARPAQAFTTIAAPTRWIAVLVIGGPSIPESNSILSHRIRPPPAA